MANKLETQSLSHYSDLEITSDSGLSEISLALIAKQKKISQGLGVKSNRKTKVLGARKSRRFKNDACIHSLSMLMETDLEDLGEDKLFDTFAHSSYLSKLFNDPILRAAWDTFIAMPEPEQAKVLHSIDQGRSRGFHIGSVEDSSAESCITDSHMDMNGYKSNSTTDTSAQVCKIGSEVGDLVVDNVQQNFNDLRVSDAASINGNVDSCVSSLNGDSYSNSECENEWVQVRPKYASNVSADTKQKSPSLADCSKVYSNPSSHYTQFAQRYGLRRRRGNKRRPILPFDIYLCDRVEVELRALFFRGDIRPSACTVWTPTRSLLHMPDGRGKESNEIKSPEPLWVDEFQRRVIRMIAKYLHLNAYEAYNDNSMDDQVFVNVLASRENPSIPETEFLAFIGNRLVNL